MRGLPSGSLPIRYNSRENEIKMRRKKTEKKQFYIGDIFRVIGLIIAFSVLLYPTVSNYLYEKNGSKVISAYDENAVRLSESDKREMLEAARQLARKRKKALERRRSNTEQTGENAFRRQSSAGRRKNTQIRNRQVDDRRSGSYRRRDREGRYR